MSLGQCPDCKKEVSSWAYTCPNCGRPFKKTPTDVHTMIIAAVVLGVIILELMIHIGGGIGR
jgi:DNA-directed RNA polymerase subunit RPC12/RpoP